MSSSPGTSRIPGPPLGNGGSTKNGAARRAGVRTVLGWGRRLAPSLVLRFAILSLIALAMAAGGILWLVVSDLRHDGRRAAAAQVGFMARSLLRDALTPADLEKPLSASRRVEIDGIVRKMILGDDVLHAELIAVDGRVVHADRPELVGLLRRPEIVRRALGGTPATEVTRLASDGGLEVLVAAAPVRLVRDGVTRGVLVVTQDYAPIAEHVGRQVRRIALGMAIALLLLYAALFPILGAASRRLRRQAEENRHQALHDLLTGLPNRALFSDRLRQAALVTRRDGRPFAVVSLDIDRFKEVNDALGPQTGDELLRQVGGRLRLSLRESDTVARLGGDQFGLLLPGVGSRADVANVASAVVDALRQPFDLGEMSVTLEVSSGAALFPEDGEDGDAVAQRADVARRAAKDARSAFIVYAPDLDQDSARRLTLAGDLRRAISGGELVVHYQPKVHLVTGRVTGLEALVRWSHPELGLLGPGEFIGIAEATGLVRPLTLEVLDAALRQCDAWRGAGIPVGVAVNLSVQHLLDDDLPSDVSRLLARHHLPADALELEITEGSIMSNPRRARDVLTELSDMGVRIAIDDFGVGYSSLGYLSELPVDVLKIDRGFVMRMAESGHEAMIVRTTVDLGHNLGLEVVAEGVESREIEELLRRDGCDLAQGFHFSRPLPANDLEDFLEAHRTPIPRGA